MNPINLRLSNSVSWQIEQVIWFLESQWDEGKENERFLRIWLQKGQELFLKVSVIESHHCKEDAEDPVNSLEIVGFDFKLLAAIKVEQ